MAGLNDTELEESIDMVRNARDERGVTVVWVEHVMKAVMSLAERVVVLNFGKTLADGAPTEVMGNPEVVQAYLGTDSVTSASATTTTTTSASATSTSATTADESGAE